MFVDASAIVAIIAGEPDGPRLWGILAGAGAGMSVSSPIAVYEATLGMRRKRGITNEHAEKLVNLFINEMRIRLVDIAADIGAAALMAFNRFGKGQGHPAQLNMGDCFAYALAKSHRVPLLFTGNDFIHTDIEQAK